MDAILGLDRRALDRARISRDPRFDGRFFIAVTSTGIYCRPVCPSPVSKSCNVRYYASAAAAEEAGFRPCLRCRPEAAPGTPAWLGTSAVVRRALGLIHDGALDDDSVNGLATRVGIGPRHLHRLFLRHVGASPLAVAQTRRLHFAKRLLDETHLPITQIAGIAGYRSVRRFNDAFQESYRRSPREVRKLRRGGQAAEDAEEVVLRLAFRPPYDWAQVRDALARRAVPGVERVDARGYARTVSGQGGGHAFVSVRPLDGENALELRVRGAAPSAILGLCAAARRTFDLAADPARIAVTLGSDALLAPLTAARPGIRIAGAWSPFEHAVCALIGKDVTDATARCRAARLVARVGRPIHPGVADLTNLFPTASELATVDIAALGLRMGRTRDRTLQALARRMAEGAIDFSGPAQDLVAALAAVPGFGAQTAELVALRAQGEPDVFPASDRVLRRMAAEGEPPLSPRGLEERAEAWRPWRGYAALYLWIAAEATPRQVGTWPASAPYSRAL